MLSLDMSWTISLSISLDISLSISLGINLQIGCQRGLGIHGFSHAPHRVVLQMRLIERDIPAGANG